MSKDAYSNLDSYFKLIASQLEKVDIKIVEEITNVIINCSNKGGTIYFCGNGGSGATASHFAGDFNKGLSYVLKKRFKAICLNDNVTGLMAIANDLSYDDIFSELLKNFIEPNDVLIGLSGSGNSANVIKAFELAKNKGIKTIALCAYKGGEIKKIADIAMHTEVMNMEAAEDLHSILLHSIKQEIIKRLEKQSGSMGKAYDDRLK